MISNIKLCGYLSPTPIQAYTIPAVLSGHDIIAVAQTGLRLRESTFMFLH